MQKEVININETKSASVKTGPDTHKYPKKKNIYMYVCINGTKSRMVI